MRHSILIIIGKNMSLPKSPKGCTQSKTLAKAFALQSMRAAFEMPVIQSLNSIHSIPPWAQCGHRKPGCSSQSWSLASRSQYQQGTPLRDLPPPIPGCESRCKFLLSILGNSAAFPTGHRVTFPKCPFSPSLCKSFSLWENQP